MRNISPLPHQTQPFVEEYHLEGNQLYQVSPGFMISNLRKLVMPAPSWRVLFFMLDHGLNCIYLDSLCTWI